MNRRHLLKGMGLITLYGSFPAIVSEFLVSCNAPEKKLRAGFFSDDEFAGIEMLVDTMLPKTATVGALNTHVPYFIDLVAKNCMTGADQQMLKDGLQQLDDGKKSSFAALSMEKKLDTIKSLDSAAYNNDPDKSWFRIVKKLALIGHFTSQEGMTTALNYAKVPGDYEACIPYKEGGKALAKTFLLYW